MVKGFGAQAQPEELLWGIYYALESSPSLYPPSSVENRSEISEDLSEISEDLSEISEGLSQISEAFRELK